ncbi:MAG TPA: glycosyltransferase [Thermoanaerobaculia bacterium]|nr:glycosyltransferase [Thermoanaerobaculia bacterium]
MSVRLSVLVPTRNEAENVEPLLERLERCVDVAGCEVVFVDDSDDDTPARIERAASRSALDVALIARRPGERDGGLGGAVLAGARAARGEWLCVLDGDLQHPPELVPDLLARAASTGADLVLASRLAPGGSVDSMGRRRVALSRCLAWVTARIFSERLAGVTDPMTGFFVMRRAALRPELLRPDGFKILLEILVRTPGLRVAEVPFRFDPRHAGRSKAGLREALRLGRTLARLALEA